MKNIVKNILCGTVGLGVGVTLANSCSAKKNIQIQESKVNRLEIYYDLLLEWVKQKQAGKDFADYLEKKGFSKIVIYGMGELGICMLDELKDSNVKVVCAIDQNEACGYIDVNILSPGETIDDEVDLVIVTPIHVYASIEKDLNAYISCPIVSLEDVIYENIR